MYQENNPELGPESASEIQAELEQSPEARLVDPGIVTAFVQRHGKYDNRIWDDSGFDPQTAGWLTPEGEKETREHYVELFKQIIEQTPEDLPVDILVVASPTPWLDEYGKRAVESAERLVSAAREVIKKNPERDVQILTNTGIMVRKGIMEKPIHDQGEPERAEDEKLTDKERERIQVLREFREKVVAESQKTGRSRGVIVETTKLREADIYLPWGPNKEDMRGQYDFFSAMLKEYGHKGFIDHFIDNDLTPELRELQQKVGAETARDIANRVTVALRGLSMFHERHQRENPGRKFIALVVSHSEVVGSFMRQGVGSENEEDWKSVPYNQGFRVDAKGKQAKVIGLSGKEYNFDIKKK